MYRVPRSFTIMLYAVLLTLVALSVTGLMTEVVPGKLGITISRNSEGFLTLLAVCCWVDVVRPRLHAHRRQWQITIGAALVILLAGVALRQAPWPSRIVTLNEAIIAIPVLILYLQLARPVPRWAFALPALGVLVPLIGWDNTFTTDMAESFGAFILIPLVVDVIDPGLLDGRPPNRRKNFSWMIGLLAFLFIIHLVSDGPNDGLFTGVTYYVQRATEMFVAAAAMLGYYALRQPEPILGPTEEAAEHAGTVR